MREPVPFHMIACVLNQRPQAAACVRGSSAYSTIFGCVHFYQLPEGVLVAVQVTGLPKPESDSKQKIFGFHIHSGTLCSGTEADPFANTLSHYNPNGAEHPNHAGDLPPLFGNHGYALQTFFTDRFSVREILHKTVVIHSGPDDFTSQPGGNAGEKIACGRIEAFERF